MTFFVCYENENKAIINYLSVNVVISHDHKFKTGKLTYKVVIRDIFHRPSIVWAFSASLIAVYILSHGRCTIIYLLHSYISKLRPHVVLKIQNYLQSMPIRIYFLFAYINLHFGFQMIISKIYHKYNVFI